MQSTKNVFSHSKRLVTYLVILGGKVSGLEKCDQPRLSSSLRPDIDILRHYLTSLAVVYDGSDKHWIYDVGERVD